MNVHKIVIPLQDEPRSIRLVDFVEGNGPDAAAVLSDLDGCLISGDTVLPGAQTLFERAADRLWVVSNISSDTSMTLSKKLSGMLGMPVAADRILLAG